MGELRDPIEREVLLRLRRAVLLHLRSITGRSFPAALHVGDPAGVVQHFTIRSDEPTDHALRADIVAVMLARRRPSGGLGERAPWVWLGRSGELDLHDLDAQWLAAACTAYGESGLDLTMVVVSRRGWRDPRSGATRIWARLRGPSGS